MKKINKILTILFVLILTLNMAFAEISTSKLISINLVNQDPDPAIAGDIVELRIGVENLGGAAANNFAIELLPKYPFELIYGEDAIQNIGAISAFQRGEDIKIVKYKVRIDRDAIAADYELDLTYYEEGSPLRPQESVNIDVKNKESAEIIHIDKTILVPGEQTQMKFTINNVGNAPLRDLTFDWVNEEKIILPVGSDNTKYIKYIDIGESVVLEYSVIADSNAEPALYSLDLHLKYDDPLSNEDKEIDTIAGVYVGGETDFDISFSESSSGETSFNIANIGSNPAYSVSVIIPKQMGWKTLGSNSEIIGNLDKGDYTVATFNIQSPISQVEGSDLSQTRQKSNGELGETRQRSNTENLKVEIAYTDTMGKRNVIIKEVELTSNMLSDSALTMTGSKNGSRMTQQDESFLSKYKWYIVIVLLIAGYYYFKKYKSKKKK